MLEVGKNVRDFVSGEVQKCQKTFSDSFNSRVTGHPDVADVADVTDVDPDVDALFRISKFRILSVGIHDLHQQNFLTLFINFLKLLRMGYFSDIFVSRNKNLEYTKNNSDILNVKLTLVNYWVK